MLEYSQDEDIFIESLKENLKGNTKQIFPEDFSLKVI